MRNWYTQRCFTTYRLVLRIKDDLRQTGIGVVLATPPGKRTRRFYNVVFCVAVINAEREEFPKLACVVFVRCKLVVVGTVEEYLHGTVSGHIDHQVAKAAGATVAQHIDITDHQMVLVVIELYHIDAKVVLPEHTQYFLKRIGVVHQQTDVPVHNIRVTRKHTLKASRVIFVGQQQGRFGFIGLSAERRKIKHLINVERQALCLNLLHLARLNTEMSAAQKVPDIIVRKTLLCGKRVGRPCHN